MKSQALIFTESSFERWWHLCHCRSQGDAGSGLSMVMGGALGNLMVHPEAPVPKLLSMGAGRGSVQHLAGPCFPPEAEGAAGGGEPREEGFFPLSFLFLLFSSLLSLQNCGAEFWAVLKRHRVVVKIVPPMLLNHTMTLFTRSPLSRQLTRECGVQLHSETTTSQAQTRGASRRS